MNCGEQIAIDGRGRAALWIMILGSMILAAIIENFAWRPIAIPAVIVVGLVSAPIVAAKVGVFGIYTGEDGG
jgi:hypothetical protein